MSYDFIGSLAIVAIVAIVAMFLGKDQIAIRLAEAFVNLSKLIKR